jgi:hypothetical protein
MRIWIQHITFDADPDPTIQFDADPCGSGSTTLAQRQHGPQLSQYLDCETERDISFDCDERSLSAT